MIRTLQNDIKFNCDVSDARFWGYFSICGLLMRYRDLFRSERGLQFWAPVDRGEIAWWIQQKEGRWPVLEDASFRDLPVGGAGRCDPYDLSALNGFLQPQGYVYGAGLGTYLKPTFFLARILSATKIDGFLVYTTGQELARDLFTAPAMLQGRVILLRREPIEAILWDRYVQLAPGRCAVLEAAFRSYGIEAGRPLDESLGKDLERIGDAFAGVLLQHELAEARETLPAWKDLLASVEDRKAELYLRAVQDLLADTSDRGPLRSIIENRDKGSLALFVGLLEGYRRELFPEVREAYRRVERDGSWDLLDDVRRTVYARQAAARKAVLELYSSRDRKEFLAGLQELVQE